MHCFHRRRTGARRRPALSFRVRGANHDHGPRSPQLTHSIVPGRSTAALQSMNTRRQRSIRATILAFDFADSDHVVGIPALPPFPLRHEVLVIAPESGNPLEVLPITDGNAGAV